MKLDGIAEIKNLKFDIRNRKLIIIHTGNLEAIEDAIIDLNLGGKRF